MIRNGTCETLPESQVRSAAAAYRDVSLILPGTILLSAFLLFQIQPIAARFLLPRFGGGTEIWTASMLFFELVLLAGYAYAHWLSTRSSLPFQGTIHLCVIGFSILFVHLIAKADSWKAITPARPAAAIVLLLAANIGIPYVTLSATAVLLSRWWTDTFQRRSPYRLYALSNLGSFAALLSYPFVVEPLLRLRTQAWIWSGLYVIFATACGWCSWRVMRMPGTESQRIEAGAVPRPSAATLAFWLALSACGAALMLATTRQISLDLAVVPFLWVLPLAIYLLSFVLCFDHERWYNRGAFLPAAAILAPIAARNQGWSANVLSWTAHLCIYVVALFVICMLCHGELARSKPPVQRLTFFYLAIAAGGAIGGVFVALVAERLFETYAEYPLSLAGACLLAGAGCFRSTRASGFRAIHITGIAMLLAAVGVIASFSLPRTRLNVIIWRNFYGLVQVYTRFDPGGAERVLKNGAIFHGFQYLTSDRRKVPTSYYGKHSGAGILLSAYTPGNRRVGVIGLGAGTLAAYGQTGDDFRFYEINPVLETVARGWFSFLGDSKARSEVVIGDARVSLEHELQQGDVQKFDVLVVDAFSNDAIPIHLLTAECADLYRRHLKNGGVLLLHISNRLLDLQPVARGIARYLGWKALLVRTDVDVGEGEDPSDWVIITSNSDLLARDTLSRAAAPWDDVAPLLWTDDFSSVWQVVARSRDRGWNRVR